jgi:hypothetical protein
MAYEAPYRWAVRTVRPCDIMSPAQRLNPPFATKSLPEIPAPRQSKTPLAPPRVTFAIANHAGPSSEVVANRFSSRRAARIANEQELAALCRRRASLWGDEIREGLDPDIARFVRDQAAAWQLLATSYARSAREALAGLVDAA